MNIQFFIEKLKGSEEFKKFKKENPKSYLTSCFITLDIEGKGKTNEYHLDFFVPIDEGSDKKFGDWWSFKLEDGVKLIPLNKAGVNEVDEKYIPDFVKHPPKLGGKSSLEFSEIETIIESEMRDKDFNNKIQKILMVLQEIDGKEIYTCTVFISGFGLLKVVIEDMLDGGGKINFFEKKSFFDMMRKK